MQLTDLVSLPTIGFGCLALLGIAYHYRRSTQSTKRPPGPSGYLFIGNLLEIVNAERPHRIFSQWCKQYGNIVRFTAFGVENIVINKFSSAIELLEKRGAIYSDRPRLVLVTEIIGWDAAMPGMQYGQQFRKHRKHSNALLNANAARGYTTIHEELASRLLSALASQPDKFYDHTLIYATSTIFRLAYDIDITSEKHHLIRLANSAIKKSAEAFQVSGALVDVFPFLKWLYTSYPDSAPFSGFKTAIDSLRKEVASANNVPLGGLDKVVPEDEHDICGLAGILYGAGQETVTLYWRWYTTLKFSARHKLRSMPSCPMTDSQNLMTGFTSLILTHWAAPLVIAIPHTVTQDDVYEGYFIPKGTSILASIYDMLNACPHPTEFNPDRFVDGTDLGDVPSDTRDVVFGFGRRRCPGLHVADNSVWTAIAQMLASFEFLPEIVDGTEQLPPLKWIEAMTRYFLLWRNGYGLLN
ncbi:hypothetical protein EWM64_g4497 [Hericium alpestre]|uniref:Cytochrome P450 n=1 Tax=Hericium alpestre TaxID=135208 RepID=A0A4Y9ZXI0_9AGAM|nr:hypothetical protein EWM64_g4497 [Hericium alpestre]